jgi:hypothetical protein
MSAKRGLIDRKNVVNIDWLLHVIWVYEQAFVGRDATTWKI